ncbi:Protein of unknown function [Cotesia congregata]|uniref:Uncharacterized protein n=1 Tax=Cotesia congregata TaxID=51543 RepID=A0A8J2HEV3_COTCN|nr:Protein of unknown function [Cotesia congregata]
MGFRRHWRRQGRGAPPKLAYLGLEDSRNVLNKKLKALDGIVSPKTINTQEIVPINRKEPQAHCSHSVVDLLAEEDEENPEEHTSARKKIRFENENSSEKNNDSLIDITGDDKKDQNDDNLTIKVGEKNISSASKETGKITPVIQINEEVGHQYVTKEDLMKVMFSLREIQQHQQPSTSQTLQPRQKTKNSPSLGLPGSTSGGLKMKEISDPGSNVFINEEQYSAAECDIPLRHLQQ